MKKNKIFDILWIAAVVAFVFFLTTKFFIKFTGSHTYLSAFVKFALLAPLGELLVIRLSKKEWKLPTGFIFKVLIWGVFGMGIGLAFKLFNTGVSGLLVDNATLAGFKGFVLALLTSSFMNLTFGPVMMGTHKVTDKLVDLKCSCKDKVTISQAVKEVDWYGFITFVVFKTIPFFWIPAHTIVFLLPPEFRLVVAALLSIALGVLLTFAGKKTKKTK
ncbi:hypothetical protein JYG23_12660 [Sedimentibacter sp. zth1]|uniref:hypothetical protein n=1 Tax=Sedimentibacter sp. zth1 TaxID=2816908 RepID=UPI001A920BCB|nr:hypothetical protein [Sedimentibacter sp. zth1]QSX05515.1 hypothetical protein JYG23_12660 [Sedimentibacter sp. zth1]